MLRVTFHLRQLLLLSGQPKILKRDNGELGSRCSHPGGAVLPSGGSIHQGWVEDMLLGEEVGGIHSSIDVLEGDWGNR